MVKSEPKKKPQSGGFFQKFFRKPEKSQKEQRLTVQRSIPYLEMGRDGICRVEEHLYSKTVRFYDINYQLAQNEDKNTIFESWCDFLNYFDASIRFQLSFINHKSDMSEYNKVIQIEPQHDAFDDVRMEYAQMLKQQLAKGNNGLVRTKYITFSIEAKSVREAKPRLERIETDILNNFKVLGVKAYPLNGVERLQIMYETFHQEEQHKFDFSYDRILQSGMTTKDFIAPTSFLFKSGKDFMMGDTYGAASYLNILAPELTDKALAEFLDMDKNLVVSIHVQSVDQLKAIKLIKGKITDLDRMKIEEQKKAVRSGYDMEIIPSDLATYGGEAKKILDDLQSRNERMFLVTVLFLNTAKTNVELDNRIICFDIKELGKQLKKLGMLIVQDQVWNRVTINRNSKKNTRYYIDEFHLLLKEEQTAAYSVEIWKRFRKWGGVPTGITQNIKDLLASREIENIFENSDFIYMLNQASGDRQILAKQLNISPFQLSYVTNSNEGEGLLFYGNTIIPFKDKFDASLKLYSLMTTKPNEMGKYKEKKEA